MPRRTISEAIRDAESRAAGHEVERWRVTPDEPTSRLFATMADYADVNLMAALYGGGHAFSIEDTDTAGVACIVSDVPVCALDVAEPFMGTLVRTLRANGIAGTYRRENTQDETRF